MWRATARGCTLDLFPPHPLNYIFICIFRKFRKFREFREFRKYIKYGR